MTYTLRSGQQGHIVLRFPRPPSNRDVVLELEKYGIDPKDISNTHVFALHAPRQPVGEPVIAEPNAVPLNQRPPQLSSTRPQLRAHPTPKPASKGCVGTLLKTIVVIYLALCIPQIPNAFQASEGGRGYANDDNPLESCYQHVQSDVAAGKVRSFPGHPTYVANYVGCTVGAIIERAGSN